MTTPTTAPSRQVGATAVSPRHPKGVRWLLWLLLLLLLLAIAAIILGILLSRKSSGNGGTVKVANTDLVGTNAPSSRDQLNQYQGQAVTGDQARINKLAGELQPGDNGQTVNDDERFFVGSDAHEVLAVIGTGAELANALPPGHRISFNGTLTAYNGDPKSIGIDPKYSDEVAREGYYIAVDPASVQVQA